MNVTIYPSYYISENAFDGSKDLAHRFIIASFLANEGFILDNVPINEDIQATLNFFKALGKDIIYTSKNSLYVKPSPIKQIDELYVDVKSSASTLRFLLPLSLNLAKKVIFRCNDDLIKRTLKVYQDIALNCNVSIQVKGNEIICSGSMSLDYYEVDGSISSQFITGLIINAIYLKKAITIKVIPPLESKKHVLMSVEVFKKVGFDISIGNDETYYIHNHLNTTWDSYYLEGDYSIASNFLALACLNGKLLAYNLSENSLQQDKVIVDILKNMGGNIRFLKDNDTTYLYAINNALLEKGMAKQLKSSNIDISECVDLSPLLMVVASLSNGTTTLYNVKRLKHNESYRVNYMIDILKSLNVNINQIEDKIIIKGQKQYTNKITISCYNDHRIAMALSIFALLNKGCITIENVECVNKSCPNFFDLLIKGCKEGAIQISK